MLISVFGGQISTSRSLAAPWTSLATCLNSCPTGNSDFTGPGLASSSPTDPFLLPCVPFLNVSIMQMLKPKTQMSASVSFSSIPTRSSRIHWTFSAVSHFFHSLSPRDFRHWECLKVHFWNFPCAAASNDLSLFITRLGCSSSSPQKTLRKSSLNPQHWII